MPRPSEADLAAFYDVSYFVGESAYGYSDYEGESLAAANAARMWDDIRRGIPADQQRPRSVLDVGCATGDLLGRAQADGWLTVGVELSAWAAERARARGIQVATDLSRVDPPPEGFGLVTMFHVVEHLPDPREALRRVAELLAPNGLVVIEVPQWRSLGRVIRRSQWAQLRPPEHITFLDGRSMAALLRRCDLEPVRITTSYPHLRDRWEASSGLGRARAAAGLLAARVAEGSGRGGYLRAVAATRVGEVRLQSVPDRPRPRD